ncbi:MAG: hypothetical protein DRH37_04975 [Deltaproteobacteria bacterium]|nr:MAG: hypothetical protein DRH37_04975 [Deltaproteobacteria bacterium]
MIPQIDAGIAEKGRLWMDLENTGQSVDAGSTGGGKPGCSIRSGYEGSGFPGAKNEENLCRQ